MSVKRIENITINDIKYECWVWESKNKWYGECLAPGASFFCYDDTEDALLLKIKSLIQKSRNRG